MVEVIFEWPAKIGAPRGVARWLSALRSLRSLLRVMIMSPRLHWLPSADSISSPGGVPARRWSRARWLSVQTSCRVGASVIGSRPWLRSFRQALKAVSMVVVGSPTWTRCRSR